MSMMTPIHRFAARPPTSPPISPPISPRVVYPAAALVSLLLWYALIEAALAAIRLI